MSQSQATPLNEDDLRQRAQALAGQLGEITPEALEQITRLLSLRGPEFVETCLAEASAIQAAGGERLANGGRARTLGGIFFRLARGRPVPAEGEVSRPPQRRQPMAWEARGEMLPALREMKGGTMSVKLVLSGRPGKVERREGTVVLLMAAGDAPPLPRGVPLPPAEPESFACYIDSHQWSEVEAALTDPTDSLILDGFCAGDPETGTVALYVQNATTRNLQRIAAAAGKSKARRPARGGTSPLRGPSSFAPRGPSSFAPPVSPERPEPPRSITPPVAPPASTPSSPPAAASEPAEPGLRFQKGMRVRHPQFGEGEVIRSEARAGDEAVTVDFATSGLRRVLARAAGLEIIGA
jgi:hypothetical protein